MTIPEQLGILLAVVGLAFAFEAPRKWFLRVLRLGGHASPRNDGKSIPVEPSSEEPLRVVEGATYMAPPVSSQITVEEIVTSINGAPPFQQDVIAAQYIGIHVEWEGFLQEVMADPRDRRLVMVNLIVDKQERVGPSIWFSEHPDRLPEIRTLQRLSKLRVSGTIESVSGRGLCVSVKPDYVKILERAT